MSFEDGTIRRCESVQEVAASLAEFVRERGESVGLMAYVAVAIDEETNTANVRKSFAMSNGFSGLALAQTLRDLADIVEANALAKGESRDEQKD